jgi:DNA-binding NarL/FixJ family response regulator
MKSQAIRILLVDDHELVRESWKILLEHHPGFSVVSECATAQEALQQTRSLHPDIVFVDLNLRQMVGV